LERALLVATCWISGAIFAAYIIAFFGGVTAGSASQRWNEALPGLHDGPIQLIGGVRHLSRGFTAGGSTSSRPVARAERHPDLGHSVPLPMITRRSHECRIRQVFCAFRHGGLPRRGHPSNEGEKRMRRDDRRWKSR
jgi:hypothetical protein